MKGNVRADAERASIRELVADGRFEEAWRALRAELLDGEHAASWSVARNLLRAGADAAWAPATKRRIRLAVLCTYEAAELSEQLRIACLALGVDAQLYLAPYGQVEQELLGVDSGLSEFHPTHVLLAPTTADLAFPELAEHPEALLGAALERWRILWEAIRRDHGARVAQHTFVVPDETPLGHLALRLPASRPSLVRELNRRLAQEAGDDVLLIDSERLAARVGKRDWTDPRLWYRTRQPVAHDALPLLARETAAVLAADVGLAARCLVLDLDNTLWGGVLGEDGLSGIVIGEGPDGEAYTAFQEYVSALRARGIVLAVASKNDLQDARRPFSERPEMRLKLEDFAVFVADWRRKPEQIAEIADALGLGLDSLVFADDNPAECAEVEAALPEVSTICLDMAPSERVRILAANVRFEVSALSREDEQRQRSYAARAQAAELRAGATTLDDFWRSLDMRARVRVLDDASLERAAQLTQKTNQFNLTLRRHSREEIERLAGEPTAICRTLELEDRFASHGLIGLAIALPSEQDPETALIDTLLLSCRVIGRTAEVHMLAHLSAAALEQGFTRMCGVYVPGPRNGLVADLYPRIGFVPHAEADSCWEYDLAANGPIESGYISDEP
ncbi:MAG: HAD-IIIC family phosphatase [Solirubrobacteraceae bacterium]